MDDFSNPPKNGNCLGHDTNMWYPRLKKGVSKSEYRDYVVNAKTAISICEQCNVKNECLEYSLRHEPYGIWGGKTESERANLRHANGVVLSREGRIFFAGVGVRSADGRSYYRPRPRALPSAPRE